MRPPFGSYGGYGPVDTEADRPLAVHPFERPPDGPTGERHRWLQWLHLALTTALLVTVVNQAIEFQRMNRRVAQLYERLDVLDQTKMQDTSAALEVQQLAILKRLQVIEAGLRDAEIQRRAEAAFSSPSDNPAALQVPPPPKSSP